MNRTGILQFMELAKSIPVIDVRSPGEYRSGHIPDAINIPLFSDQERAIVGTKYAQEGNISAVIEGIRLSGPSMHLKIQNGLAAAKDGKLLVHCWRGGMRSEAMAWLFSMAGLECTVLEGGYKAFRHYAIETIALERNIIVLAGMTGSGKTDILRYLKAKGHQVIDLELLANHKGSAFGSIGQQPQPTTEQFENELFSELQRTNPDKPLWVEDESRNIGTVFLNNGFYNNLQKSKTVVLIMDVEVRIPRLMEEYSKFPPALLKASIMKISKRLGGDNAREATEAIASGDMSTAIGIVLRYYDKTYQHSLKRKNNDNIILVETLTDDVEANACNVMKAAGMNL